MMYRRRRITKAYFDIALLQYAPLIHRIAFQIGGNSTQVEEMKIRAADELLKCMICYEYSGSFMTFLYGRLTGIFRHMRNAENKTSRVGTISLDSVSDIAAPCIQVDSNIMVEELLGCLSIKERSVIVKLFFDEKTIRETSRDCEMVPSMVHRVKTLAINKMRQKCENVRG